MASPAVVLAPVDPTSAEYLHSQRKCNRCQQLYTMADEDLTCTYHPGHWVDPSHTREGAMVGWSCCRIAGFEPSHPIVTAYFGGAIKEFSIPNQAAFVKSGGGCKTAPMHEEDEQYRAAITSFPFDAAAAPLPRPASPSADDAAAEPEDKEDETSEDGRMLRHPVSRGDTLVGLSLKYGVPVQLIKQANKIPPMVNECYQYKVLLIPTSATEPIVTPAGPETSKMAGRRLFKNAAKCSTAEAAFYMDEHGDDLQAALQAWREDAEFEAEQGQIGMGRSVRVKSKPSIEGKKRKGVLAKLCGKGGDVKEDDNSGAKSKSATSTSQSKTKGPPQGSPTAIRITDSGKMEITAALADVEMTTVREDTPVL